jgi:hypothetical protein
MLAEGFGLNKKTVQENPNGNHSGCGNAASVRRLLNISLVSRASPGRPFGFRNHSLVRVAPNLFRETPKMSEQELVFQVKELHVISLRCASCGHGTIFDFKSSDYLEKMVSPTCSICKTELAMDLREQLEAYRGFYESMSACEQVEFRVRLERPEASTPDTGNGVQQAVSAAVAEVQGAVTKALAKEAVASGG